MIFQENMPRALANEHDEGVDGHGSIYWLAVGKGFDAAAGDIDMTGAYMIMVRYAMNTHTPSHAPTSAFLSIKIYQSPPEKGALFRLHCARGNPYDISPCVHPRRTLGIG